MQRLRLCSHWAGLDSAVTGLVFVFVFLLLCLICLFVFVFFFFFFLIFWSTNCFYYITKEKKYRESQKTTEPYFEIILYPGLLRGNCTPNQKLACFVLYFKIIHTFLKIIYAPFSKLFKELKNGIEILNWPIGFYVMDQNSQSIVLINSSSTDWPTYFSMLFLISLDNLL